MIPVAGFEPASPAPEAKYPCLHHRPNLFLHFPQVLSPLSNALVNASDFLSIALPFVDGDVAPSPRKLYLRALNDVPCRPRPFITTNLDDLISNDKPLFADQLKTSRVIDSEFVNLLLHEPFFLTLACAGSRRKTQQLGSRVNIEAGDFISPRIPVYLPILADRTLGFDHPFQMLEDVAPQLLCAHPVLGVIR